MPGWAPASGGAATSDPAGWPYEVERREDCWIPLPASSTDGQQALRLSCSLWLPHPRGEPQTTLAVPAVLEYLPYRWGDATYIRDYCRHPYVCGHGFACVRVDIRGSGDSEGEYHGEYLAQEQEEMELIQRLQATQVAQKQAYAALEDALQQSSADARRPAAVPLMPERQHPPAGGSGSAARAGAASL